MKGMGRSELFSSPFSNGDQLQAKIEKDFRANVDNCSDIGSDRDDKFDSTGDHKSPLNATALATLNFYRNINESLNLTEPTRKQRGESEETNNDIMRLYQEQIAKLFGQQFEEGFRNPQNYDDLRNVMAIHELSRINPFAAQALNPELFARLLSSGLMNGGANYPSGLPLGLDSLQQQQQQQVSPLESLRKNSESQQQSRDNRDSNSTEARNKIDNLLSQIKSSSMSPSQNGSQNAPTGGSPSSVLNNGDLSSAEDLPSPLQRIQSITNSLLSQSSLPSLPSQPPRPSKAVLPPITQQQFDQYNNLNTEDIVKRVKEQLSQYSISQRLFGESVLGLSQGSVSDLLARPKPWHMLTQKGREPFIRMKMFLEDDNAIHKLVASQYKIAPEKLMRTGSFVAGTAITGMTNTPRVHTPPTTLPLGASGSGGKSGHLKPTDLLKYEQSMSPSSTDNGVRSNSSTPDLQSSAQSPISIRSRLGGFGGSNATTGNVAINTGNLLRQSSAYMQPSVYELAALTSDLDTQNITTRIKETLMAHNIGQKVFNDLVLAKNIDTNQIEFYRSLAKWYLAYHKAQ